MKTEKLTEIKTLRSAAANTAGFWKMWRETYLADSSCDKKGASFTSRDDRFCSFKFNLMFETHAGYYGSSSCSTVFHLESGLAQKYFTRAIQQMAEPLFARAAELMLADAVKLTDEAEAEVAALQAMLDEVRQAAGDPAEPVIEQQAA